MQMPRAARIVLTGLALVVVSAAPLLSSQSATAQAQDAATSDEASFEEAMALGEQLYVKHCAACHGVDGTGPERAFPGNPNLEYAVVIASQVIHGGEFMPRFPELTDEEVAAIGTYMRNSWGNSMGPLTEEDIAQYR